MKRVALLALLLWPLSATAADENYRAQLQSEAQSSRPLMLYGSRWVCQGSLCRSAEKANASDENLCAALVRARGPVVAFAHGKRSFGAKQIVLCNKMAADAKAPDAKGDDEKPSKADPDDGPRGGSTTDDKTPGDERVKKPKKFGTFRVRDGFTVTGTGKSPLRKFPPLHISADGFEVHGTGTGAKRVPFPPLAWRTEMLTITGTAPLSEPFGTFRTSGLRVIGTGESAPTFPPISFRTGPLVVTGTGTGAKRPPFPPLSWRTTPFALTGTAPLSEPFGTFRTGPLVVAGTGVSAPAFPPISFRTGPLVVTGTGAGAKRPPFTPIEIRTETFRITGAKR